MSTEENLPLLTLEDCRATATDPQLGVHELSECAFCHRAFLILHENKEANSGAEREINLDYEPAYFPETLKAEIAFLQILQRCVLGLGLAVLLISLILGLMGNRYMLLAALLSSVLCFGFAGVILGRLGGLRKILKAYALTKPVLPGEAADEILDVDWRALVSADYQPLHYENALIDADLKLGGKPWCYLRKDELRIPVFYYRMQDATAERRIRRQHLVRIAAYCHLIETREQHPSPFGVILFADSYDAKVVPNNETAQQAFLSTLLDTRLVAGQASEGTEPEAPPHQFCSACPWGYPVRCEKGESPFTSNGRPLPIARKLSLEGTEVYHSWCGDRFLEAPPHNKAVELGVYES